MADFKVNDQSAAVQKMARDWELIDALVGGTAAMRAAGKKYLPQFPKEEGDAYSARLKQAVLFNAFAKTSATLAAKPLSRPMKIAGISPQLDGFLTNIDMYGTDIHSFVGQVLLSCMRPGLDGVLVDMQPGRDVRTKADEKRLGLRPYMTRYPASSILGWRSARDANGSYLTQLRLMESIVEPDGAWGEVIVPQVRVLEPGKWQTWRQDPTDKTKWVSFDEGTSELPVVPFVFFYGIHEDFGIGCPPLLDLAHMNVEHWQNSSDQQNILHVARVPVLFAKGFGEDDELAIGASQAASTTHADADLKYVEHTGAAIGAGRQSILDLEDRMRQIGAELLLQRPSIVTATQVRSDDEGNRSVMQQIAEDTEDALERCLQLMAMWLGDKETKPEVELFKDFGSANLSEKGADILLRAAQDGHVSSETVFEHLQRMDIIDAQDTWSEEEKRLNAEAEGKAKRAGKEVAGIGVTPKATLVEAPPT